MHGLLHESGWLGWLAYSWLTVIITGIHLRTTSECRLACSALLFVSRALQLFADQDSHTASTLCVIRSDTPEAAFWATKLHVAVLAGSEQLVITSYSKLPYKYSLPCGIPQVGESPPRFRAACTCAVYRALLGFDLDQSRWIYLCSWHGEESRP